MEKRPDHNTRFPAQGEPLDKRGTTLHLPTKKMDQFIAIAKKRGLSRAELNREIVLGWLAVMADTVAAEPAEKPSEGPADGLRLMSCR